MTTTNWTTGETLYATALDTAFGRCIDRAGDIMNGMLTLAEDPVNPLDAVTLRYLDNTIGARLSTLVIVSDTEPTGVVPGTLWWDSVRGNLYILYQDPNSTEWVAASATAAAQEPSTAPPLMDGIAAAGSSIMYSRGDHVHPSDTSLAPLVSPALTGVPTAPTPATADSSTTIATTAFVKAQGYGVAPGPATVAPLMSGTAAVGTSLLYARQDHVHPTNTALAPTASPTFTGVPAAPTATVGTSTTQLATTAFVQAALPTVPIGSATTPLMDGTAAAGSSPNWARGDHVHPTDTSRYAASNPSNYQTAAQVGSALTSYAPLASPTFTGTVTIPAGASIAGYAPLASPALTGTPNAPTATAGTSTTQLATTAFVQAALPSVPTAATTTPLMDGTAAVGTGTTWARADHVHQSDTSLLPLGGGTMNGPLTISGVTTWLPISLVTPSGDPCMISSQVTGSDQWLFGAWAGGPFWIRDNTTPINAMTFAPTTGNATLSGTLSMTTGLSMGSNVGSSPTDLSKHIALYGTTNGFSVTAGSLNIVSSGSAIAQLSPSSATINGSLSVTGAIAGNLPAAKTGTAYSVAATDSSLILNPTGAFTLTLPAGSAAPGRILFLKLIAAFTVSSATANVVPLVGGAATTAIMTGTAGKFCMLQSDGTNWQIMEAN